MKSSIPNLESADLYERLGIERSASLDEVRRAYRSLVREFPPERAPERFKLIREAFETLSNSRTREEYDRAGPPELNSLLATASQAMQSRDYSAAERLYKQAVVFAPELAYVRNLLGLSLLYQHKADEASAIYARLLREPNADAVWFGNAGHAFRMQRRFSDAEEAFREAVVRAEGSSDEYYLGWADVLIEKGEHKEARDLIERAIGVEGSLSFDDAPLVFKQLDACLFMGDAAGEERAANRLKHLANDDIQRRRIAIGLGSLSWRLITAEVFGKALIFAQDAQELQPEDVDYEALADLARALMRNDHDAALRIVRTHISFAPNGWLHSLGPAVERYCDQHAAFKGLQPIKSAPPLRTINGIGTMLYGQRDNDARTGTYVTTLYFVFFLFPVFPLASYRVQKSGNGWRFFGKASFGKVQRWHLGVSLALVGLFLISLLTTNNSGPDLSAPTAAPIAAQAGVAPTQIDTTAVSAGLPAFQNQTSPAAASTFTGTVTNNGLPDSPGSLSLQFDSLADTTTGRVEIGSPLAGSGWFLSVIRKDSVYIVSASPTGDTILWKAARSPSRLKGRYWIRGGPYASQGGVWSTRLSSGARLNWPLAPR